MKNKIKLLAIFVAVYFVTSVGKAFFNVYKTKEKENNTDIKICPFCEGKAESSVTFCGMGGRGYYFHCTECGASTKVFDQFEEPNGGLEAAKEAWNRRVNEK